MKLFKVDFKPVYPVGCGLVILAETMHKAEIIATATIVHTDIFDIEEISMGEAGVVFYQSGDY